MTMKTLTRFNPEQGTANPVKEGMTVMRTRCKLHNLKLSREEDNITIG
jgi:hypothetical protein